MHLTPKPATRLCDACANHSHAFAHLSLLQEREHPESVLLSVLGSEAAAFKLTSTWLLSACACVFQQYCNACNCGYHAAQAAEWFDPAQYGCMYYVIIDPSFWFLQVGSCMAAL